MVELKNTNEREIMNIAEKALDTAEAQLQYLNQGRRIDNFDMNTLEECVREAFEVPNSCLPEEFHDHRSGSRSLAKLHKLCKKRDGETQHKKQKDEKARRVEIYRKQFEETGEINFIESENHASNL